MEEDRKKNVRLAIEKYLKKQEPQKTRDYNFVEKEVVKDILAYCKERGWSVDVVDSKATYVESQDRYLSSQAPPGFSDIVGCDLLGTALYIEVKAPGRRSTLRSNQRDFLIEKISRNAFAVCVDSRGQLDHFYLEWKKSQNGKKTLLDFLPPIPKSRKNVVDDTDPFSGL